MSTIDFGTVGVGEAVRRSVPGFPLFGSGTTSDPRFSIVGPFNPQVVFTATAADAEGPVTATLTAGSQTWTLTATIAYSLTVDASHGYGTLAPSSSAYGTITVTNRTPIDATLAVTGDGFTLAGASSVPAGTGPLAVSVVFTHATPSSYSGSLVATAGSKTATCALDAVVAMVAPIASVEVSGTDTDGDGTVSASETKTTYKVHVPSSETRMHLGAAVAPFPNLDGFGIGTAGKGLLRATGNIGINSSSGHVLLQAQADDKSILTVSGGNSVFAAKGSAYLVGDGGVLVTTALNASTKVGSDGLPNPDDMTAGSNKAALIFAAFDGFVAAASAGRALYTTPWKEYKSAKGKAQIGVGLVSAGSALFATFLAGNSVGGGAGGTPLIPVPGVTVYGHAGVLVGTPGFGGFYAAAGLVLSSVFPVMIGMDAEILGLRSTAITGLNATVTGWKAATVESGGKVEVTAKDEIAIEVKPSGSATSSMTLEDEKLTIIVGKYAVTINASTGIEIGFDKTGAVDADKGRVWIDDAGAYVNGPKNNSWVKLEDGKSSLNGGSSTAKSGQVQLKDDLAKMWAGQQSIAIDGKGAITLEATEIKTNGKASIAMKAGTIKIG